MALILEITTDQSGAIKGIKATGKAVDNLGKKTKKTSSRMAKEFKKVAQSLIGPVGIAAAISGTILAAGKMVKMAGLADDVSTSFRALSKSANLSADVLLNEMTKAVDGTISSMDLMKQANTALLLGLPITAKDMGLLADAGQRLGKAMGVDALKGLESLTVGIGRQSRLWLDNLGIIVDVKNANDRYAISLGKTTSELTDADKKLAFYNATMESVRKKLVDLGPEQLSFTDMFGRLKTKVTEASIAIGKLLTPALIKLLSVVDVGEKQDSVNKKQLDFVKTFTKGFKEQSEIQKESTEDLFSAEMKLFTARSDAVNVDQDRLKMNEDMSQIGKEQIVNINDLFDSEFRVKNILEEQLGTRELTLDNLVKLESVLEGINKEPTELAKGMSQIAFDALKEFDAKERTSKTIKEILLDQSELIGVQEQNVELAENMAAEAERNRLEAEKTRDAMWDAAFATANLIGSLREGQKLKLSSLLSVIGAVTSIFNPGVGQTIGKIGQLGSVLGFANGGSFKVGGSGGIDSQLVAFKATPGETVNVTNNNSSSVNMNFPNVSSVNEQALRTQIMPAIRRELRLGEIGFNA